MKCALITTTINAPTVLELYRRHGPDVAFFVAGDRKSPDDQIVRFLEGVPNHAYYGIDWQHKIGYKCSRLLGENTIARRNIALLEAVKSGADLIISIDDDVLPLKQDLGANYFEQFERTFKWPFNGIQVSSPNGWYDPGQLLTPTVRHRGLPMEVPTIAPKFEHVVGAKIGVAAGLWIGDADVGACDRIAIPPAVHSATELAQCGVVVDIGDAATAVSGSYVGPKRLPTKTVFNTQSVAFLRELAPAMFMNPHLKRYDDIVASLVTQRVMRDRGMHVHFGKPFAACWQDRSKASLLRDLEDEVWGMWHVKEFADYLDKNPPGGDAWSDGGNTIEYLRAMYDDLRHCVWWPEGASEVAIAFLDDCEAVL